MDQFSLIADPTRRRIIDSLRVSESDVKTLISELGLPQPYVSKHLRTLRDAGVVTASVAGNRRVYRLAADPLRDVLAWAVPYYEMWSKSLDRLSVELDAQERR